MAENLDLDILDPIEEGDLPIHHTVQEHRVELHKRNQLSAELPNLDNSALALHSDKK